MPVIFLCVLISIPFSTGASNHACPGGAWWLLLQAGYLAGLKVAGRIAPEIGGGAGVE
jgi:hypothetical protein